MEQNKNRCLFRPLKSGIMEKVGSLFLSQAGLSANGLFDRSYALIDKKTGRYLRRSNVLKLALLGIFSREGIPYIYSGDQEFPLEDPTGTRNVKMKKDLIEALIFDEGVNEFINSIIGRNEDVELVKFIGERKDKSEFNIGFADNNVLHVVSYEEIDYLRNQCGHSWVSGEALGANLVVNTNDTDNPFKLTNAKIVSINGHEFEARETKRCIVPTINDKGERIKGANTFLKDLSKINELYLRTNEKGPIMGGYLRSLGKLPEGGLRIDEGFKFEILK